MKKLFVPAMICILAVPLLTGCLALSLGGGSSSKSQMPTLGQQLIDLQKAKDSGAISDSEYQAQKAKLLNGQ